MKGGCLFPEGVCTETRRPVADVIWEKDPYICVPPAEKPMFVTFKYYEEVSKTVPLEFSEDDVMWVASNLSYAARAIEDEAIDLRNWILCF